MRSLGYSSFYIWSLQGVFYSLIARIYVYTFSVSDINPWTIGRAKRVNLWHGVGIKNIEFKCKIGPLAKKYNPNSLKSRFLYPHLFFRPHLFLSTSPLMTKHFSECFRIPEKRCIEAMYPRNEILLWSHQEIKKFLKKHRNYQELKIIEDCSNYSYVYIYMPTWRENKQNILEFIDLMKLNDCCAHNDVLFLFKLHPNTEMVSNLSDDYSNLRVIDSSCDVYPILPFTNVLITDYSSISYDAFYRGSNVIFYWEEKEECLKNYGEGTTLMLTESLAFGEVCYSQEELQKVITESYNSKQKTKFKNRYQKIVEFHDNKNTERIIKCLKKDHII